MKNRRINADKPHLWKADIAASVDRFNQWCVNFAPEALRSTRVKTTQHVKRAILASSNNSTLPRPADPLHCLLLGNPYQYTLHRPHSAVHIQR
jgi:hypothetical protein